MPAPLPACFAPNPSICLLRLCLESIKMKQIILFIIMLAIHQLDVIACSCVPLKSFCEESAKFIEWNPENVIIVRGEVVDVVRVEHRRDLIIEIHESFYNPQNLTSIRIKDGNGADCGQNLEHYGKGDELIFTTGFYEEEGIMGQFSICDPGPLIVDRNRVRGFIRGTREEEMSLNAFRNLPCIPSSDYISFYPNPTSDQIQIVAEKLSESSKMEIYLYNLLGQCILRYLPTNAEKVGGAWTIPLPDLAQGTYYLYSIGPNNKLTISPVSIIH